MELTFNKAKIKLVRMDGDKPTGHQPLIPTYKGFRLEVETEEGTIIVVKEIK